MPQGIEMLTTERTAITPELFLLRARESCNGCLKDELDSTTLHPEQRDGERGVKERESCVLLQTYNMAKKMCLVL